LADTGYDRIALVGDPAAGGLALVLLAEVSAEARGGRYPRPTAAAVMSPWTDQALEDPSMESRASADPLLDWEMMDTTAQLYVGEADRCDPTISPLYGDLSGLTPVCLHVGGDDVLPDDSQRYADRIEAAGDNAELHVWHGMVHVFPANLTMLRASGEALNDVARFLREQCDTHV
jgi:monoterpene epsilon-lactone hydrolase